MRGAVTIGQVGGIETPVGTWAQSVWNAHQDLQPLVHEGIAATPQDMALSVNRNIWSLVKNRHYTHCQ